MSLIAEISIVQAIETKKAAYAAFFTLGSKTELTSQLLLSEHHQSAPGNVQS